MIRRSLLALLFLLGIVGASRADMLQSIVAGKSGAAGPSLACDKITVQFCAGTWLLSGSYAGPALNACLISTHASCVDVALVGGKLDTSSAVCVAATNTYELAIAYNQKSSTSTPNGLALSSTTRPGINCNVVNGQGAIVCKNANTSEFLVATSGIADNANATIFLVANIEQANSTLSVTLGTASTGAQIDNGAGSGGLLISSRNDQGPGTGFHGFMKTYGKSGQAQLTGFITGSWAVLVQASLSTTNLDMTYSNNGGTETDSASTAGGTNGLGSLYFCAGSNAGGIIASNSSIGAIIVAVGDHRNAGDGAAVVTQLRTDAGL